MNNSEGGNGVDPDAEGSHFVPQGIGDRPDGVLAGVVVRVNNGNPILRKKGLVPGWEFPLVAARLSASPVNAPLSSLSSRAQRVP